MAKTKVQPPKLNAQMLAGKVGTNPLYKGFVKAGVQATDPKKDQDTNSSSNMA
jgi:hypothetical protein